MTAIPCAYGCGAKMSPEHAEGGIHYQYHRARGDRRIETATFRCRDCGMEAWTDDLTIVGRNCMASDFERAHRMEPIR